MLQPITKQSAHNLPLADPEGFVLPSVQDWRYSDGANGLYDGYAAPELRQAFLRFVDPLTLNFKLIINTNATTGLFAGADKILIGGNTSLDRPWSYITQNMINTDPNNYPENSALGYLFRIGETERGILLANWIFRFMDLVKNYDFLIQEVEGLDSVVNPKPWEAFTDETISVKFRETSDQRVQSLIMLYREIWYDADTGSVVIPTNLNRIDVSILVYQAGYFLSDLFDAPDDEDATKQLYPERFMFPTRKKLNQLDSTRALPEGKSYPFIYHNFRFKNALINVESGADFFTNINNSAGNSDMVMTTLKWNFWGCDYTNCFHGEWGEYPMKQMFVFLSKINEINYLIEMNERFGYALNEDFTFLDELLARLPKNFLGNFKDAMQSSINNLLNSAKGKVNSYINSALKKINAGYNKLNNYLPGLIDNFSQRLFSDYEQEWTKRTESLMKNQLTMFPEREDIPETDRKNKARLIDDGSMEREPSPNQATIMDGSGYRKTGSSAPVLEENEEYEPAPNSATYGDPVGVNEISKRNSARNFEKRPEIEIPEEVIVTKRNAAKGF